MLIAPSLRELSAKLTEGENKACQFCTFHPILLSPSVKTCGFDTSLTEGGKSLPLGTPFLLAEEDMRDGLLGEKTGMEELTGGRRPPAFCCSFFAENVI